MILLDREEVLDATVPHEHESPQVRQITTASKPKGPSREPPGCHLRTSSLEVRGNQAKGLENAPVVHSTYCQASYIGRLDSSFEIGAVLMLCQVALLVL